MTDADLNQYEDHLSKLEDTKYELEQTIEILTAKIESMSRIADDLLAYTTHDDCESMEEDEDDSDGCACGLDLVVGRLMASKTSN